MGLLNGLGMVAAGAGEGYGKGTAAVGAVTLDSLLKEAQMLKEDNLARLRQGDQNTFNASQSAAEREARAAENKDNRQFQTDLKGIEFEEQDKREAAKQGYDLAKENDRRAWELKQEAQRQGHAERLAKGSQAHAEKVAGMKTEAKDKDNAFTDLPDVIKNRFTQFKFDDNGFKIGEEVKPEYGEFNLFWRKSGLKSPYDALAAYDELKMNQPVPPKPGLDSLFPPPPQQKTGGLLPPMKSH